MQPKKLWLRRASYFLLGLVLAYFAGCYTLAQAYISPTRRAIGAMPTWAKSLSVSSSDHEIPAWVSPELESGHGKEICFLLVHGYGGTPSRWTKLADGLAPSASVAIIATEGQTVSPSKTVGFAVGEADEIVSAAQYIRSKGSKKVIVVGISMGGSAAWIAGQRHPELLDAIVTEGAFARLDWASHDFLSYIIPNGDVIARPVIFFASAMKHLDPDTVRPDLAAASWRGKPGFLIHGMDDTLISVRQRDALAAATGLPVWEVPHAGHSECQEVAGAEYLNRLLKLETAVR